MTGSGRQGGRGGQGDTATEGQHGLLVIYHF